MEKKVSQLYELLCCASSEETLLEESFEYYQNALSLSKDIDEFLDKYDSKIQSLLQCTTSPEDV